MWQKLCDLGSTSEQPPLSSSLADRALLLDLDVVLWPTTQSMPASQCALLVVALTAPYAAATVIGAAFLPHGDFTFDPSLVRFANGSRALHDGAVAVGARFAAARPDVIFVSTPHGESADVPFLFLDATAAHAQATIGTDLARDCAKGCYEATLPVPDLRVAENATRAAVARLRAAGFRVAALSSFADTEPAPLRWGELIPLSFLNATLAASSVVVMGQPTRRFTDEVPMVAEELALGAALFDFFEALDARVLVVVSGDLAHTHLATGPYGYSPAAAPFDAALGRWAATLDAAPLLDDATALADAAKSCGYTGAVMLHGFLNASARPFAPRLVAGPSAPTYYGMLVAEFLPPPRGPASE